MTRSDYALITGSIRHAVFILIAIFSLFPENASASCVLSPASFKSAYASHLLLLSGIVAAVSFLGGLMSNKGGTRDLAEKVDKVAAGDLTVPVESVRNGGLAVVAGSIGRMQDSISGMINSILSVANKVMSSADILRNKSALSLQGAKEQAQQAARIAAAAEEMSQTITDIARSTSMASETTGKAIVSARRGHEIAAGAVTTMGRVHEATIELSGMIDQLNRRVTEIGNIVTIIKDIADQTNLLALNAAIEAARAGEQGRGFSVVADEVRKLAERTITATTDISQQISAVQSDSAKTNQSMQTASQEVTLATGYMHQVGSALTDIVTSVQLVSDQVTQIATAVDQQSVTSEEIAGNIDKTSKAAQEIELHSDEVAREVGELVRSVEELRNASGGFKTRGGEGLILDLAKTDHRIFVGKLFSHMSGDITLDASKLPDHHTCRFGKWYDTDGFSKCSGLPSYARISGPHEQIHRIAREAVSAFSSGDKARAQQLFHQTEKLSEEIGIILDDLKQECTQRRSMQGH